MQLEHGERSSFIWGTAVFVFVNLCSLWCVAYLGNALDQAVLAMFLLCQAIGAQEDSVRNDQSPNIVKATIDVNQSCSAFWPVDLISLQTCSG